MILRISSLAVLLLGFAFSWAFAAQPYEPAHLNPVTWKTPATHPPIVLADGGRTTASIALMVKPSPMLRAMVAHLQNFIEQASGAKLPITQGKITPPAIVILPGSKAWCAAGCPWRVLPSRPLPVTY